MRVIDLMNEHKELLSLLFENGVTSFDIRHLDAMNEYIEMKGRGFKTTFAVEYLSEKHCISATKFY